MRFDNLSQKQREYLRNATRRWNVKSGAVRSGKTFLDYSVVIPKRVAACGGEGLIVLIGNTRSTLERNVLAPMRRVWSHRMVGRIAADNTVKLFGRTAYALGADRASQAPKLQGAGIQYCYGDEVTTWHPEVFRMLGSRLDRAGSRFDGTCNPANPGHWFKEFLDSGADLYHQEYTIDDNPFLPKEFVENLKREYAGTVYYDRYILGRWKRAQGLVYPGFSRKRHVMGAGEEIPRRGRYFLSVDYGTRNPFAAGLWCYSGGVAYLEKEFYHDGRKHRQLDDGQYHQKLEELAGGRRIEAVVADPSAASFLAHIYNRGRFQGWKADNAVLDGIRNTAAALNRGWLRFQGSCGNTLREFEEYAWDESAGTDQPLKESDHAMDMVRYFVQTVLVRERDF